MIRKLEMTKGVACPSSVTRAIISQACPRFITHRNVHEFDFAIYY